MYFQAGVNIKSIEPSDSTVTVTFGAMAGRHWHLEYTDAPGSTNNWTQTTDVVTSDDRLRQITDSTATNSVRFYRVVGGP